ncbi:MULTISPECIES: DUF4091 domain-containing protein [Bacillota]|uniref:DUF4091 domain-containing protein n=1 Tax=Bacillota TaxID=1239 RepID=UPI003F9A2410
MKANFKLLNSAYKHIAGQKLDNYDDNLSMNVLKNEEFGLQLLIDAKEEFVTVIDNYMDIPWKGLIDKVRVNISAKSVDDNTELSEYFKLNLVDYVMDDEKNLVADKLMNSKNMLSIDDNQLIYITGKLPKSFDGREIEATIQAYHSKGYDCESLIFEKKLKIKVSEFILPEIKDSDFFMDLWQHPCNWARIYDVPYYGDEHMEIIDNYMEGMSKIGQRVCDLIISDYPWAGQQCFRVEENHMNLFELNIVKVIKNKLGNILCDFSAMDKYIEIARKHNMLDEINIFGIIGNWDAFKFGNPLEDYKDPIRISYFDEKTKTFKYISNKEELRVYISLVFNHLKELGVWDRTLIMSDEPNNVELFRAGERLLKEANNGENIDIKCAIHDQEFLEGYGKNIRSVSLNTCELVKNKSKIDKLKQKMSKKGGKTTWFSCCFPQQLNIFLKSPLIESRLIGWFTYYMDLEGFLRWAYGIWPGDIMRDASYKKEKWAAGDMYFVYPGKNGKPMESIRLKNLIYGIQDWMILKLAEKNIGRETILEEVEKLLGNKEDMKFVPEREVEMFHSLDYLSYIKIRDWLIDNL